MDEEQKKAFEAEWPRRQDFYSSVGQAISAWAAMETYLVRIASCLLTTTEHKTGLMFYSIMNFHSWLAIIDELFALDPNYSAFRQRWIKASENLKAYNDIRVRLAHNTVWDAGSSDALALRPGLFDARPKSKNHEPLTNAEIVDFTGKVVKLCNTLGDLHVGMYEIKLMLLQVQRQAPSLQQRDQPQSDRG